MIYTMHYPESRMKVDTDRIAEKYIARGQLFARPFFKEGHINL
jgi:hypothetical protein